MPDIYSIRNIDFAFNFATTALGVGGSIRSGGAATTVPYVLDQDTIMEIAGAQIIGPVTLAGVRQKLEHVKLVLKTDDYKHVVFNELTAPPINQFQPNIAPQFFTPNSMLCHNIGMPMLAGGAPTDATPKLGPGSSLAVEVKAPVAADGGAAITQNMVVRLTVVEVKGEAAAKRILEQHGSIDANGNIPQSFELVDLEEGTSQVYEKSVPFKLGNWTKLHGGMDAETPRIWPFVKYSQNMIATTVNSEYAMSTVGTRVRQDFMDFAWNFDETEAVRIEDIGVMTHANLMSARIFKTGRSSNPWYDASATQNELPMPQMWNAAIPVYQGPSRLPRPFLVWDDKAQVEVMDNGTAVPAWAAGPIRGTMVALWGKYYELPSS